MAPVAGRVTNGNKHRLVLCLGGGERLGTPWPPVDRVIGMLAEVEGGLEGKSIGHVGRFTQSGRCAIPTFFRLRLAGERGVAKSVNRRSG